MRPKQGPDFRGTRRWYCAVPAAKNCEARSAMTACDQSLYYFASIILPFLHDLFVATP